MRNLSQVVLFGELAKFVKNKSFYGNCIKACDNILQYITRNNYNFYNLKISLQTKDRKEVLLYWTTGYEVFKYGSSSIL